MTTFGQRTVILRKRLGLTQKEFADAGSFSQSNLSLLENDGVIPNLQFIISISEKFPVDLNWWIRGEGSVFISNNEVDEFPNLDPNLRKFLHELKDSVAELKMANLVGKKNKY